MTMTFAAAVALALAALFGAYYRTLVARPPDLVYRDTALLAHVRAACPALRAPYRPPWWSFNRHLQLALLAWRDARTPTQRFDLTERVVLADGGTVSLEWLGLDDPPSAPT